MILFTYNTNMMEHPHIAHHLQYDDNTLWPCHRLTITEMYDQHGENQSFVVGSESLHHRH